MGLMCWLVIFPCDACLDYLLDGRYRDLDKMEYSKGLDEVERFGMERMVLGYLWMYQILLFGMNKYCKIKFFSIIELFKFNVYRGMDNFKFFSEGGHVLQSSREIKEWRIILSKYQ